MAGPFDPSQLTQDPDFMKASHDDQVKFLSAQDPDFAKAQPADQEGYLTHLTGRNYAPAAPAPNAGLAPPAGAAPKLGTLPNGGDTGEGPIARTLTSGETNIVNTAQALPGALKSAAVGAFQKPTPDQPTQGEQILSSLNPANLVVRERQSLTPAAQAAAAQKGSPNPIDLGATGSNILPFLMDMGKPSPAGLMGHQFEAPLATLPSALKNMIAPKPENNLINGMYSREGVRLAAPLRSASAYDLPAETSRAVPALKEAAADIGVRPNDWQGRNGLNLANRVADHAIDITEARAKSYIAPYRDQLVPNEQLSPELKAEFTPEQLKNGVNVGDVEDKRLDLGKKLRTSNFYAKPPSAQYAAQDPAANWHAAANNARDIVYNAAEQTPGVDLRDLKQQEASLIKIKDVVNSTGKTLSQQLAKYESTGTLSKVIGQAKRAVAIKANPTNAFEPGLVDPTNDFNNSWKEVTNYPRTGAGTIMKNGKLLEPGPAVLTPPPGKTPGPVGAQGELGLQPNAPHFELTPPAGTTPPAIQPRQSALPLTSSYAPMGEHAGLTSNIPGEAIPGRNLNLTGGNGINTPMQNLLDFSKAAHPEPIPLPKSLGAAAAAPEPAGVPGPLREAAGLQERRAIPRSMTMSQADLESAIKNRKPVSTPFDDTVGARETMNRDLNMPKQSPVKLVPISERPGNEGSILSVKLRSGESAGEVALRPNADLGKGAWEVSTSYLKPEFRGKGFGSESYQQMVDYARQKGATALFSDDKVSPGAANVWESMAKKGQAVWDPVQNRYRINLKASSK